MLPVLALIAAVVTHDQASLRASPRDQAPRQAVLWAGDWLEVRGEQLGFLQVYDHRRERPGYVRAWQVRRYEVVAASAPALRAVVDFLRDSPGAESLGIAHAALFLRAAPAAAVDADLLDALGGMAERLARRASRTRAQAADLALAAHLEVAATYGVRFVSFEAGGRARLCYDGEAFRLVLALQGAPAARARAALALTNPDCVDPALGPVELHEVHESQLRVLDQVELGPLPAHVANRVRLRRAAAAATLAYERARRGQAEGAAAAAEAAMSAVAGVVRPELADDDAAAYQEVVVRVAAARWAGEPPRPRPAGGPALARAPGAPGQTCLRVMDGGVQVLERCTYGLVWDASLRIAPGGGALAVAVQPLPGWVELWVFRRGAAGWQLDPLVPAPTEPELGYVELAGWSADGAQLLVAREARVDGALQRRFELVRTSTLEVVRQARSPRGIPNFKRLQSPDWASATLALR